jgi:hypothetical protein
MRTTAKQREELLTWWCGVPVERYELVLEDFKSLEKELEETKLKLANLSSLAKEVVRQMRVCEYCHKPTRVTTAGCDHCDVEDK